MIDERQADPFRHCHEREHFTQERLSRKPSQNPMVYHDGNVPYLTVPVFDNYKEITHGFSTRLGGVGQPPLATMNLSFNKGEPPKTVTENYKRISNSVGFDPKDIVLTKQTHTANIRIAEDADRGKGFDKPRDYDDIDGLITDIPGIVLTSFFADCVPLLLFDPVKKVIGNAHSGWKGTIAKIGTEMVKKMVEVYYCNPRHIMTAIGPSICQDCYEVSTEVIVQFQSTYDPKLWNKLFYPTTPGKYQLNLWEACKLNFMEAGIPEENISLPDLCTKCNSDLLYSRRVMGETYGNFAAFLMLK